MDRVKQQAVGVTSVAFALPSYKITTVYLLVFSFIAGIAGYLFTKGFSEPASALFFGGAEGVILLAFPAVLASAFASSVVSRKAFKAGFRRFVFVSLLASIVYSLTVLTGFIVSWLGLAPNLLSMQSFVLIGIALIFLVWFIALFVALNYGKKSLAISFFHSLISLAFLIIWSGYGVIAPALELSSPWLLLIRMFVAAAIMLVALWSIFFIINAPAKRNFGVSAIQASALFFAQLHSGAKGLEEVLAEMGEKIQTQISTIAFRNKDGRIKASFVVPFVHFGPFGNLGGSEFPALMSKTIAEKTGAPSFIFHGTAFHDFNPVYSSTANRLSETALQMINAKQERVETAGLLSSRVNSCDMSGLAFGQNAFLSLSRAPEGTEDIDFSLGIALANRVKSRGFTEAILVDRHNCKRDVGPMEAGSKFFFDYQDAADSLRPKGVSEKQAAFKLGIAGDPLSGFSFVQGIGRAGLKVAVFEFGSKRAAIILVDANNCLPEFRSEILGALSRFKFDFVDLFTTDTHAVNNFNSVHNPLGFRTPRKKLVEAITRSVEQAIADLEPCTAAFATRRIELEVLGNKRSSELLSTINSVVAILKILALPIFVASLAIAFAVLLLIK